MHDFALRPIDTPADVSGHWTMAIIPSAGCGSNMPDIAKKREYHVDLVQHGTGVRITFTDSTLTVYNPQLIEATVFASRVAMAFPGDTGYDGWSSPDIYERLSPTQQFGFDGTVSANVTGSQIIGKLSGDLTYWQSHLFDPAWYCRAKDHSVVFRH